ncbi:nicotinate-nucleotide--dimethylbenzimidazole phosphoribosyltransferase [Allostreptomyces psammosilenae]|uniref:nicotinate-nucleotide--dimethylbenzimidazole phosphoribosyltransferase n=1 Tax=Allostreptomyces psammosilenae TaxID=1892865 RepID=UPI001FEB0BB4|nr:nicotinate-nucleotide--dimethylbenzimidazole phosphoribosyltransferase [Allostreptomyces psammosilenae]
MDVDSVAALVGRPDQAARDAAGRHRLRQPGHVGSLGRLERLAGWLSAVRGTVPARPAAAPKAILFAGDHGVAELDVSTQPPGATELLVRQVLDGTAPVAVLARRFGAELRVVDMSVDAEPDAFGPSVARHRVRRGSGRVDVADALTREEAEQAFRAGMAIADEEADSGTDLVLLGDLGRGSTTVAAVLVAAVTASDAASVVGRGSGIDDYQWMHKCAAIRDALRRARRVQSDPIQLLATSGGADYAAMCGFLLQAAVRRLPVVLDGVASAACALLVQRMAFRAPEWWVVGSAVAEPAQEKALARLGLEPPLLDQGVDRGEGIGSLIALPLIQAAADLASAVPAVEEPPTPDGADADGTSTDGAAVTE